MPVLKALADTIPVQKTGEKPTNFPSKIPEKPHKIHSDWLNSKLKNNIENVIFSYKNNHKDYEYQEIGKTTPHIDHPNIYLCDCSYAKTFRMTELGIFEWSLPEDERIKLLEKI